MLRPSQSIYAASLAVYIVLYPLIVFNAFKHGRPGLVGWLFLLAFAGLQLASSGLQVSGSISLASLILGNVGLSPLILAADGILKEVNLKLKPRGDRLTFPLYALTHASTIAGVALVAYGVSDLYGTSPSANAKTLWRVGAVLLVLAFVVMTAAVAKALVELNAAAAGKSDTATLLWAIIVALPFIGIKAVYGVIFAFTQRSDLSSVTGTIAVKVLLIFLPQALAATSLVVGGLRSRKIEHETVLSMNHNGMVPLAAKANGNGRV